MLCSLALVAPGCARKRELPAEAHSGGVGVEPPWEVSHQPAVGTGVGRQEDSAEGGLARVDPHDVDPVVRPSDGCHWHSGWRSCDARSWRSAVVEQFPTLGLGRLRGRLVVGRPESRRRGGASPRRRRAEAGGGRAPARATLSDVAAASRRSTRARTGLGTGRRSSGTRRGPGVSTDGRGVRDAQGELKGLRQVVQLLCVASGEPVAHVDRAA